MSFEVSLDEPRLSDVLARLHRAVRRQLSDRLDGLGLSLPEYTALSTLRARHGQSNAQLARRALITPQSMIRVVAELERKRLIAREPDPDHGRALRTALTVDGEAMLAACDEVVDALEQRMLARLNTRRRERLLADLGACAQMLEDGSADPA